MAIAELALESLGGTLDSPISDDERRKYGEPIRDELRDRIRSAIRKRRLLNTILAPLALLFWVTCVPLLLLAAFLLWLFFLPFELWDSYKAWRKAG